MQHLPKRLIPTQYMRRHVLFGDSATDSAANADSAATQSTGCPRILNLSNEEFPFTTQPGRLEQPTGKKFDFVYGEERMMVQKYSSPVQMMNGLLKLSSKGMLETVSPLEIWLEDTKPLLRDNRNLYMTWTDMHTNTLCLLPYWGRVDASKEHRASWRDVVAFEPAYLKNYFIWTHALEWNLRLQTYETEEEYEILFMEGVRQATGYTRVLLEHYGKFSNPYKPLK
jgi:hypothetical protein